MAVPIQYRVNAKIDGLKRGNVYLGDELGKAGAKIGRHIQSRVRQRQRIDTGEERRRTVWRSKAKGSSLTVVVSNDVVQALVDETGASWKSTQPPSHPGSKLYAWVSRKGLAATGDEKEIASIAFRVARSIARRGLPRPGDPLRKPFENTFRAERRRIIELVGMALAQAVRRMNQGSKS